MLAGLAAKAQCTATITWANNGTGNISFTAAITGSTSGSTYSWDFADGTTGTGLNPNHTYTANGSYVVTFTITSPPSCTFIDADTVTVTNASNCSLAPSFNITQLANNVFSFSSTSTGTNPGTQYKWNFGDTATITAGPTIIHTYPVNGTYTVGLTVINNPTCTLTYSTWLSTGCNMTADFKHVTASGGLVFFSDTSQGAMQGTTHLWNFGDGVISSAVNPTHTYLNAGTHYVSLKLSNGFCTDSVTKAINITGVSCYANSGFNIASLSDTIWTVQPAYPWNVTGARWEWGDGSSSNMLYSSHVYPTAGFYTICLTVTVSCDSVSSTCVFFPDKKVSWINIKPPGLSTGIQQTVVANRTLVVYPNPGNGLFTLELNGEPPGNVRLSVYNLTGSLLLNQDKGWHTANAEQLDLSDFPEGIYYLRVSARNYTCTQKLIIRR